jgi:hypothetical protein
MKIFEKKDKLTTEQFIRETEQQIAELKVERERVKNNIRQGFFIRNNEARLAKIDEEIQDFEDKITFAKHREQMGVE